MVTVVTTVFWASAGCVALLTAHTALNATLLRRPRPRRSTLDLAVSVLLPVRDEAHQVRECLKSVLAQRGVARLEVVVLDDGSSDGTADAVREAAAGDPRVRLVTGREPPPGWLGKPYACQQLAALADPASHLLIFIDADVVLTPNAVATAADIAMAGGFDLVSPYPRIEAVSTAERLVQPLLQWSLLTFLPLRMMEHSRRPALAAAGGQFLVIDRDGYRRAGGHAAVRAAVLDDVELARAVKRAGGRIALADGSRIARCRMYTSWSQIVRGYGKSLWASFGSGPGATVVVCLLLLLYTAPILGVIIATALGAWNTALASAIVYLLGVTGRIITAGATRGRVWPDVLAHPVSIGLFAWLVVGSFRLRRHAQLTWKGRDIAGSGRWRA